PMITSAGQALYQRNPIAAPISAAATIARSSFVSNRWPGRPDRIQAMTFIAANVNNAMIPVGAPGPPVRDEADRKSTRLHSPHFPYPTLFRSPMITSPGQALYQRNPIAAPISAAATIARSSFVSNRWPGRPDRIQAMTFIAANVNNAMIPVGAPGPPVRDE